MRLCCVLLLFLAPAAHADTGDYIWNEQFKKKLVKAETGDVRAQYDIGNMHLKGQGTNVDESAAFEWFSKAANQGHKKSQYKVGFLYLRGKGVKKNASKAAKWLRLAANSGYGPAQYHLGRMYWLGEGVRKNYAQALKWYEKAEKSGYTPASKAKEIVRAALSKQQRARRPAPPAPVIEPERVPVKAAAPKPASKPSRVKIAKAAPKKSASKPRTRKAGADAGKTLFSGFWTTNGFPADTLPSTSNSCKQKGSKVVCKSLNPITKTTDDADIIYLIEAEFSKFSNNTFLIRYRRNIKDVLPIDLDDPDAKLPKIKLGWEKKRHTLQCKFKNDNLIACLNEKKLVQAYTRQ